MTKTLFLVPLCSILMAATCNSYNRVLKSSDRNYKLERAMEYYNKGNYYRALPLLEELLTAFRGDTMVETVYYYYCHTHFGQGTYVMAAQYFKHFHNSFPHSRYAEEMLWKHALSFVKLSPSPDLDQTYTRKAIDAFQLYVNLYPASTRVTEANAQVDKLWKKLEIKDFNSAMLYYDRGQYKAAAVTFENVLEDYPASDQAENIEFLRVQSLYLLAANSTERKRLSRYSDALKACTAFEAAYPGSQFNRDISKMKQQSLQIINTSTIP